MIKSKKAKEYIDQIVESNFYKSRENEQRANLLATKYELALGIIDKLCTEITESELYTEEQCIEAFKYSCEYCSATNECQQEVLHGDKCAMHCLEAKMFMNALKSKK